MVIARRPACRGTCSDCPRVFYRDVCVMPRGAFLAGAVGVLLAAAHLRARTRHQGSAGAYRRPAGPCRIVRLVGRWHTTLRPHGICPDAVHISSSTRIVRFHLREQCIVVGCAPFLSSYDGMGRDLGSSQPARRRAFHRRTPPSRKTRENMHSKPRTKDMDLAQTKTLSLEIQEPCACTRTRTYRTTAEERRKV